MNLDRNIMHNLLGDEGEAPVLSIANSTISYSKSDNNDWIPEACGLAYFTACGLA